MLIKGFWQLADPKIWIASTIPMLLAAAMALTAWPEQFSLPWFVLALAAVYLIEIGKNAIMSTLILLQVLIPLLILSIGHPFPAAKKLSSTDC